MTLATRCPSCETIFRMTTQEATARGGTVRCGVCGTAFNALDALVNVETLRAQAPATVPHPPVEEQTLIDNTGIDSTHPDTSQPDTSQPVSDDEDLEISLAPEPIEPISDQDEKRVVETTESSSTSEPGPEEETETSSEVQSDRDSDTQTDTPSESGLATVEPETQSEPVIESSFADTMTGPQQDMASPEVAVSSSVSATDALLLAPVSKTYEPSGKPGRRSLFVSLCAVALMLLTAQVIYVWRDTLAASWPAARPLLIKTCALLGCRVDLPMNLDALAIESSELQAVPQATNSYTFNTLLRNRGQQALRYPALELTLTDALDQLVLRRVILPAQYLGPAQRNQIGNGIAPNSELPIRISFDVAGTTIVGYRVGIFYP